MKAFLRDTLTVIAIAAVMTFGIQFVAEKFIIDGPSMTSANSSFFQDGEWLLVNRIAYAFHQPERGDVIILQPPTNPKEKFIKRIIGLPGESVEIKGGIVYIHKKDGKVLPLVEPYIADPARQPFEGEKIPENEYFVLGDNRNDSGDSRGGWTLPRQNIIGKVWLAIWPPGQWGIIVNYLANEQ